MLASSACTFLLLLSFSQGAVICWQCLFYGASVAAWNGLEVISVELYPSSKRYSELISGCRLHSSVSPSAGGFIPVTETPKRGLKPVKLLIFVYDETGCNGDVG